LLLQESHEFELALLFLFALLLLGQLQLLVPDLPELSVLLLIAVSIGPLLLLPVYLKSARPVNRLLHLELALLLLLVQPVGLVLSLGHLLVQHLLLVVLQGAQLLHLSVDHLLSDHQFVFGAGFHAVDAHLVHFKLLLSELFDTGLLFKLLLSGEFGGADLVGVGLHNVGLDAGGFLLALEFTNFLALKVLLSLALDKLTLEHLLLELLNVVYFEFFELVRDSLGVVHLFVVLTFELGPHLGVVLFHLLLFKVLPVVLDLAGDRVLAGPELALGVLLVHHVGNEHFALERLDHVL